MSDVVNLNRFRKKKAREEKSKCAETNRRLHGRTKAERFSEDAAKKRREQQGRGALLVSQTVSLQDGADPEAIAELSILPTLRGDTEG